ncbi:hypothetical protein OCGS_0726 [Oceaniovalibus guishaninsula JLT2003]|uniref:DUF177 domain-containing protein n=1 Tax=Oceaniovalibus guishaninsula JLT2003 TaxID=1231392 RepID=K2GQY9_9RHOB|nr:DUF177 domain-containing protein [Oceaniovalibus guishaninsula]EKE45031.1 hypothetical protein OCGS_0726 [Oceaniovalibus guishaninsula JLT2003]
MMRKTLVRLDDTSRRTERQFEIEPDAEARAAMADALGLDALRKLRFRGTLTPHGRRDWTLRADLGATVVQPCGITLAPVTTRIDDTVERTYLAEMDTAAPGGEVEMPQDVTQEPLPAALDLDEVLFEALALAVPAFPRAPGAEIGQVLHAEPGTAPMRDEDTRPFAGLRDAMKDD